MLDPLEVNTDNDISEQNNAHKDAEDHIVTQRQTCKAAFAARDAITAQLINELQD